MGLAGTSFAVYGIAGLGLGGMWGLALGLYAHHARCCRVARGVVGRNPRGWGSPLEEGPALVGGAVELAEDEPPSPVLSVGVPAPPAKGQRLWARPFTLALGSGAKVRVEPEEGRWSLDTTFVPVEHEGERAYVAVVEPGDELYVRGSLHRDTDPRAAGRGYRDVARAWVMRGDLMFSSKGVIAAHADRAAFHRTWAMGLGALFAGLHLAMWSAAASSASFGPGTGLSAVLAVLGVGLAYQRRAEVTAPWLRRKVRVE